MKTNLFFIVLLALVPFNGIAFGTNDGILPQKQKFYSVSPSWKEFDKSKPVFLPGNSLPQHVQIYANYGGEWYHQYNREIKYNTWNEPGSVLTSLASDSTGFSSDTMFYDANGRLTVKTCYTWDNEWILANRVCINYDLDGNKTQEVQLDFSNTPADTTYFEQLLFQNGYIIEYYNFINFFGYKMELKVEFEYSNTMLSEMRFLQTNYITGQLEYTSKYNNIEFQNYSGNYETDIIKKAKIYEWIDSQWEFAGKLDSEFGDFGSYVRLIQQWDGTHFINFQKETMEFDSYLNPTEEKTEYFENEEWIIYMGNKYLRSYNGSFLVSCIFQEWNEVQAAYTDMSKEIYSNFLPVEIKGHSFKNSEITIVFTSPGSDVLHIMLPKNIQNEIQVTFYNLSGETRFMKSFLPDNNTISIAINGLRQGLYIVEILTHNYRISSKFVKL